MIEAPDSPDNDACSAEHYYEVHYFIFKSLFAHRFSLDLTSTLQPYKSYSFPFCYFEITEDYSVLRNALRLNQRVVSCHNPITGCSSRIGGMSPGVLALILSLRDITIG